MLQSYAIINAKWDGPNRSASEASHLWRACVTLGENKGGLKRRGTRDVHEAGVPVLPAGAGLLQLAGRRVHGVRRAERPRAAQGDVRVL